MCNLMHNDIKCKDVYLQRCFKHHILLKFIDKVKISEANIIACGCPQNNTGYGILEKILRDIGIHKKFLRDIGIEIPYLSLPLHFFLDMILEQWLSNFNHCVKSVQVRSFRGPYFPVFGVNTVKYSSSAKTTQPLIENFFSIHKSLIIKRNLRFVRTEKQNQSKYENNMRTS